MNDDNPYEVLGQFPILDYSDGAVDGFDINSVPEPHRFTTRELECLFEEEVSAASVLVRLLGEK